MNTDPRLSYRRIVIDTDQACSLGQPAAETDFCGKEVLSRWTSEQRFAHRRLPVSAIGAPGRGSDRELFNDYFIFGDSTVRYTTETSFGMPFRAIISRAPEDIAYWKDLFDVWWSNQPDGDRR